MTLENLTQLQKIAIEGEVAGALSSARHNPEILYRLYTILQNVPKEVSQYVVDVVKDLTDIEETELNRVLLELSGKEFPLWIWVKKTVADIKLSLTLALADSIISDASMDKKLVQQKIIKSAFVCFCRSTAMASPRATIELCKYIMEEESKTLDFLANTCFSLINEVSELTDNEKIPEDLLHKAFDVRSMLSFRIETEVLESLNKKSKKQPSAFNFEPVERKEKDRVKEAIKNTKLTDVVDEVMAQILNEALSKPKDEIKGYAVVKKYEGNNITSVLRTFKTEKEAIEFRDKLQKEFPEITKTCSLDIKVLK